MTNFERLLSRLKSPDTEVAKRHLASMLPLFEDSNAESLEMNITWHEDSDDLDEDSAVPVISLRIRRRGN